VDRLAGDPERVPDLLPRPPVAAGSRDLAGLDSLREPVQRERRAESDRRVIGGDLGVELLDVDAVNLD
jgi:hypothetical protein